MRIQNMEDPSLEKDLTDLLSEFTNLSKQTIKKVNSLIRGKYNVIRKSRYENSAFIVWDVDDVNAAIEEDDYFTRDFTEEEANEVLDNCDNVIVWFF